MAGPEGLSAAALGIETPAQLHFHPLRGAIFENWVVVEFLKAHLNRGEESRLFFWRDNVGQEIDVLREHGARLRAWECKSGMTFVPEWTAGLAKWSRLAGPKAGALHLVYGGDESFTRQGVRVMTWRDV